MEASQPKPERQPVHLEQQVIEDHLESGEPVEPQKAKIIWLMNKLIDKENAHPGEW